MARLWPAVVSVCLPYGFVYLVYQPSVEHLLKDKKWTALGEIAISGDALDRFARNVHGLFMFGIASGLLRATVLAAIVVSIVVLRKRLGSKVGFGIVGAIVLVSLGFFALVSKARVGEEGGAFSGFIRPVIKVVLNAARAQSVAVDVSDDDLDRAILLNVLALTAGFSSLIAAFGAIAIRATPLELTAESLRDRGRALEWVTVMTAAVLVFVIAVNKALIVWPQALLTPEAQKTYAFVAGAIADYWGVYGSGALICALVPTYVSLMSDVSTAARAAAGDGIKAQENWRKENGLDVDLKSGVLAAIAAAAPVMTGPGMELFGRLVR